MKMVIPILQTPPNSRDGVHLKSRRREAGSREPPVGKEKGVKREALKSGNKGRTHEMGRSESSKHAGSAAPCKKTHCARLVNEGATYQEK